jgi:hypothetical protein
MARKQLTEAEKATTEFTESVEHNPLVKIKITDLVRHIELALDLTPRTAAIALRDYAQLLVAQYQDATFAQTQQQIKELQKRLGRE